MKPQSRKISEREKQSKKAHMAKKKGCAADIKFLRTLSDLLRNVPVMYGPDGYHIDELRSIATKLELENG